MIEQSTKADLRLPVYLDNQATTPLDPRVLDAMMPFFTERFGNPASLSHAYGREAAEAVETARAQIAELIGADPREIVVTSGATESNNLALQGAARFHRGRRDHIVTLATEHKCVLESARFLETEGVAVTYLPVRPDGLVDIDRLKEAITDRTVLVSVMAAHNEIGVVQPLAEIGAVCREHGVYFHTDAAQAVGKIPLDVDAMGIDLMSISGHKIYGPKGIGALYVRRRPRTRIAALVQGGGQERGMRSGTQTTPLIVGLGAACAIAGAEMAAEIESVRSLRDRLYRGITERLDGVRLNGSAEHRLAGNLNLEFAGTEAECLLAAMTDIAASTGSACTSAAVEPSYVLRAVGRSDAAARSAVRFGIGRFNTEAEIDYAVDAVVAAVEAERRAATEERGSRAPTAA